MCEVFEAMCACGKHSGQMRSHYCPAHLPHRECAVAAVEVISGAPYVRSGSGRVMLPCSLELGLVMATCFTLATKYK